MKYTDELLEKMIDNQLDQMNNIDRMISSMEKMVVVMENIHQFQAQIVEELKK